MTAPAHLTEEQFARYTNRTLTPPELLELDEHLCACAACRDRLYAQRRGSAAIKALRAEIAGHLEYAEVVACSEGMGTPQQRQHLRDCAMCQGEVLDLSRFRTELQEKRRAPLKMPKRERARWRAPVGIAAAVILVAGAGIWMARRSGPDTAHIASQKPAEPSLPPADRQMLDLAIASKRLERAPVLDGLISKPGAPLGAESDSAGFELLAPVGTTVLSDRPVLRWTPPNGGSSYVVSIFDEHLAKIAESPVLTDTDWKPVRPLPRGRLLSWQVSATVRGRPAHAPAPPAPAARFQVVPQPVADHIEATRRDHPGNPLLLAVLFAQAGALDDAQQALEAMEPDTAQRYKESIQKIRKP